MFRILVAEDDVHARRLMETVLRENGYEPLLAADGQEAMEILAAKHIDLLVLDVMMPGLDGLQLTRQLRESGSLLPILMVTALETREDKKQGFLTGADDYMVKPVDEEEMLLRIAALLRRSRIAAERRIEVGDTVLDYDTRTMRFNGKTQVMPQKEFQLLFQLLSYPQKIFTRRQLMDEIWDLDTDSEERTVDVHINRLRDRLKGNRDIQIVTVRGLGYKAVRLEEERKI